MIKLIDEQELLKSPIFKVVKAEFSLKLETQKSIERWIVKHPGAVVIMPLDDRGFLYLAEQYRYPIGQALLEFPAGCLEQGEEPLQAAKRELAEELKLKADSWTYLNSIYSSPGFTDEILHLFLAKQLSPYALEEDEDEYISIKKISVEAFKKAIQEGRVKDAKSLAITMQAQLRALI